MEGKPANADNPQSLFNSINPGGLDAPQLIIKSPTPQRLRYPTHFTMLLDTNEPPSYYAATQDQAPSTHGDAKYETMDELESVAPSYKDRAPSVAGKSVPYPIPIPRNYGSTPDDNDLPPPPAQADDEFYSAANRQVQPARPNRGHKFCIAGGLGMLITYAVNQVIAHRERKAVMRAHYHANGGCSKGKWGWKDFEDRKSHFERKLERKAAKIARKQERVKHWREKKEARIAQWAEKREEKDLHWAERRERRLARRAGRRCGDYC